MQQVNGIAELLRLRPSGMAPEIIIYCEQDSPRLQAACHFIFETALQCRFKVLCTPAPQSSMQPALVYASQYTGALLQIVPQGLLNQKGTASLVPDSALLGELPVFFPQNSELGFDLFSAVFYFISRYEEYQDYQRDEHERFERKASVLFQKGWHLQPLLETWCQVAARLLENKWPDIKLPGRQFQVISSIDVDNLFAYRHKGFIRTAGAALRDVLKGDWTSFRTRLKVLSGKEKDPFDVYGELGDFCCENKIALFCFFLMRSGTKYDRSVHPSSPAFKAVVRTLTDNYVQCGLHPSYDSKNDATVLKRELEALRQAGVSPIISSRQHFLRFDIRRTPALLQSEGIAYDFTMGFATGAGFRAGTSLPFHWYNFEEEKNENLVFVPFCAMDGVWSVYGNADTAAALRELEALAEDIRRQKGVFMSVFHERSFSDHLYPGFGTLYKKLHSGLSAFSQH